MLVLQDNGFLSPGLTSKLKKLIQNGATVLNFLDDTLARDLGLLAEKSSDQGSKKVRLATGSVNDMFYISRPPYAVYDLKSSSEIQPFLQDETGQVIGYRWNTGKGQFIQVAALFYDVFNSDAYSSLSDVSLRRAVIDEVLALADIQPRLRIIEPEDKVVAFGRQAPEGNDFWITTKSAHPDKTVNFHLIIRDVDSTKTYRVINILEGTAITMSGVDLLKIGLPIILSANGSAVFRVQDLNDATNLRQNRQAGDLA